MTGALLALVLLGQAEAQDLKTIVVPMIGTRNQVKLSTDYLAGVPSWCRNYQLAVDQAGKLWLYALTTGGDLLYVQPAAWRASRVDVTSDLVGVTNYGVDLPAHPSGQERVMGTNAKTVEELQAISQCTPDGGCDPGGVIDIAPSYNVDIVVPALVLGAAICFAAILTFLGRKRGSQ